MNSIVKFVKESIDELRYKVSWSTFSELQSSTILVIIGSLIFAMMIGLMDFGFKEIIETVYNF